ncbi:UNVERIFIED_CONTAM: Retrovirus-related Pol polyprotein from type-2 retrotransposable element R2DM [Sesamum angustifolium]|uniref:Retrovirus-related Pol polyprotein from type-2 retrotransposable element R2DM n=1 Tax=Sesamum angustifolium TaxID=2727405 RepID=A0AAW2J5N4_9LAMI
MMAPSKLRQLMTFFASGSKVVWSSLLVGPFKIPKNNFILWLAIMGKLSTLDKPWLHHTDSNCILCTDGAPETHDHLFFTCSFSRRCLTIIRQQIPFLWPHRHWQRGIHWASSRWRGKHVVNAAFRSLLASLVYHIWQERNSRRFQQRSRTPSIVGNLVVEEVRQRIISVQLRQTVSTFERAIDLHYLRPWARHILTEEEAYALIRPVTVDDVKTAMFDIEEDKAPGPDGFSSGFYKAAWPIVGEEISKAIMDFFTTGRLLKQVNATVLTLIPKVRTPHSVSDFRPISCCNVIYKVISKILVGRFREILDLLISPSQNAFVPGRLISDNVLLAQELFSGYNQCRLPPRCALKVDLRKAYDTVEWDFLFATLRLFGFPAVFIRWIEECVTSAHYSVVVNGGVHGFFAGARGLRQGDPMSPYLFVLVMEVLQMILQQFIDQDGQFLYHWRCTELKLFQLSFADDLLLLCKADVQSKIDSRIKGWEGVQLSFAGRVQLIKSVLVSLEVYWAMAFILPKGIIKEMIKRLRTFLWKGTSSSGYPKVAWEIVCRPVEEGGQGIKDIFALNRALMSKHLWAVIKQVGHLFGWIGSSRFDCGTVQFGQLRITKVLGVGGKCSHLDIYCYLISIFVLGWNFFLALA